MNIFVLDENPIRAAEMMCDKHIPKMVVESAQMMASALRRHGVTDERMPLTKSGTPYKGGYQHHPCTVWAGDTRMNFMWLATHALALCKEYEQRFHNRPRDPLRSEWPDGPTKEHACRQPILHMIASMHNIPEGDKPTINTPFALAMPDEFKVDILGRKWDTSEEHGGADDAVKAYRRYYHSKTFAKWEKGTPAPDWWMGVKV